MVDCGTVEVLAAFDSSAVTVSGCNVSPTDVSTGDTVTASASVQNNNADSRARVTLRFDAGNTTATDTVTVRAGGSATGSADFQFTSGGNYSIGVSIQNVSEA